VPSILCLSTYPIQRPAHGGQIRLRAIADCYRAAGWEVSSLAVYDERSYSHSDVGSLDHRFPAESIYRQWRGRTIASMSDFQSGIYAAADDGGFPAIECSLPKQLDVIHVEQPWLWPLVARIRTLPGRADIRIIYGSQNIEAPLKRSILAMSGDSLADAAGDEVAALEQRAVREADLTLAVTADDLDVFTEWGVARVVLAPNGITPWHASADRLQRWRERLPKAPWALYVASAHPPNFSNFIDSFGESLACIPPDSRLVVAGGVSEHLYRVLRDTRWGDLNLSRLQLLFVLSDEDLAAVKTLAQVFLLPITVGGGSNIKTAEALYSGKHVIGTETAFRGFRAQTVVSGIHIAHTPADFQRAVRTVLCAPPLPARSADQQQLCRSLCWDACLAHVPAIADHHSSLA
jgi:glycosyltransferase involved in cell wall biosynthesis